MAVTRYQNMYLGFLQSLQSLQSLYSHPDYMHVKVPKSEEMDIQLTWSLDGFDWERHPERPIFYSHRSDPERCAGLGPGVCHVRGDRRGG